MSLLAAVAVPHPPIILPEVGHGQEAQISKTTAAYREAMALVAAQKPETVIVLSPHSVLYADYFHISPGKEASGSFARFGAPQVQITVEYDRELAGAIAAAAAEQGIPAGTLGERDPSLDHATLIPLYFLREQLDDFKVVRIGLSGLPYAMHYRFGQLLQQVIAASGRRICLIASGDLSHKLKADGPYGFVSEGPQFDAAVMAALGSGDFLSLMNMEPEFCEKAAECGHRSFVIMAGAFDGMKLRSTALSYEGPFGVGYGVATFVPDGEDPSRHLLPEYEKAQAEKLAARKAAEDPWVRLARASVEHFVRTGQPLPLPSDLPPELTSVKAGAFVSLKKQGQLRGCIGTIAPVRDSLAEEIIANGVSACAHDPRFPRVEPEELPELVYSVDVLNPPERITRFEDLDPKVYGVIVSCEGRRGLLLPDLEGVDTIGQQVEIARRKGGIPEGSQVVLERFTVTRHH